MAADSEPTVTVKTVDYVEIRYGAQKIVIPAGEAIDLVKPLAALMPDDLHDSK